MAPNAPQNPSKLVGTHWTAVVPGDRCRHWEVVEYRPKTGLAIVEAVLDKAQVAIAWRELRDREVWRPGWEQ